MVKATGLAGLDHVNRLMVDGRQQQPCNLRDDGKQWAALEIIDQEIRPRSRLLNDLMEFSRSDTGRLAMRKQAIHQEVVFGQLSQRWAEDPVGSRLKSPKTSALQVRRKVSDLDQPKQGLINLVEKALNHTPAATAIQLSVLQERNPLIFERFRQGRFESGQGGSGLGLAVARMLMRTIRGDVKLIPPGPEAPPGPTMGLRPMNAADPYHYPTPFQEYKAPIKGSSQNFEPAPTICRDPA
jgi:signal transduction histidine kinase